VGEGERWPAAPTTRNAALGLTVLASSVEALLPLAYGQPTKHKTYVKMIQYFLFLPFRSPVFSGVFLIEMTENLFIYFCKLMPIFYYS